MPYVQPDPALRQAPTGGTADTVEQRPWWREPYVWMVIAGPASAVLACAVTAYFIFQGPDALVSENAYQEGLAMAREVKVAPPPMVPAHTARNHNLTEGQIQNER